MKTKSKKKVGKEIVKRLEEFTEDLKKGDISKYKQTKLRKVKFSLIGIDINAFALLGHWQNLAKKQGWTQEKIKAVLDEAMSADYNHLLNTLDSHCE